MAKPVNGTGTLLERGIFAVYGALWRVARPLLRRHKRLREDFAMRLVPDNWGTHADIWVQAASGGEAYLTWEWLKALPLFTPSSDVAPEPRILLTSCTRQGLDVLHEAANWVQEKRRELGLAPLSIAVYVFPLDEPRLMRRALRMVSPRMVVLLETELWPSLMRACRDASVPVTVLNGRMSPRSFAAYFFMRSFWKSLAPKRIAAISHDDAMRFSMLFGTDVDVVPNMKFDRLCNGDEDNQTSFQPESHAKEHIDKEYTAKPHALTLMHEARAHGEHITLLASVREEEEPLLVATLCALIQNQQTCSSPKTIIIAPRHMHRVGSWQDRLRRVGIQPILRSALGDTGAAPQNEVSSYSGALSQDKAVLQNKGSLHGVSTPSIIIWDTFGELDALYGLADAVFVGGSLMPLGGQNFLEPLAKGRIPCVGPYLNNFAWVEPQNLVEAGLLSIVRTDIELAAALCRDGVLPHAEVQTKFQTWLAPRLGGAKTSAERTMDMA